MQTVFDIAEICARHGIKEAIVCPGSRCAPLTISFARHPDINVRTISDERSAAFIGLGIALQTKKTVVLICTSGTAAANFYPAIIEAFYQNIPLLVLTADRPPEWIDQRDGQTIRQQELYGRHVKKAFSFPVDHDNPESKWYGNRIISEAINASGSHPAGPVHINIPLREPFYPEKEIVFSSRIRIIQENPGKRSISEEDRSRFYKKISQVNKILIVPGQALPDKETKEAVSSFSTATSAVIVSDSISNFFSITGSIKYHDTILCGKKDNSHLKPELLITFGNSIISKSLKTFLRQNPPDEHWHIQEDGDVSDTYQCLSCVIRESPKTFFAAFPFVSKNKDFQGLWHEANQKAEKYLNNFFPAASFNEMEATKNVLAALPQDSILHLANSMPVRYANYCGVNGGITVYTNRGTSGIDGVTSTALGAALCTKKTVTVLTGDMAFLYDRNALWNKYIPSNLRIVVLNNHGGGIFRMIDGPSRQPELEEYFVTDQPLNARHAAIESSLHYSFCHSQATLKEALTTFYQDSQKAKILEIETDGAINTEIFRRYKELKDYEN